MSVWRDIEGVVNGQAAEDGSVRVWSRGGWYVLKPFLTGAYFSVKLDGKTKSVHRVICTAFHGPPPSKKSQTRHLNGDSQDNRAANLAWGTGAENQADRFAHGTAREGTKNYRAQLTETEVKEIMKLRRSGCGPAEICRSLGVKKSHVKHVIYGQAWNWLTGLPKNRH